jgi:hypothetical protein
VSRFHSEIAGMTTGNPSNRDSGTEFGVPAGGILLKTWVADQVQTMAAVAVTCAVADEQSPAVSVTSSVML